jgi:negative regulator of flagellin synthesis FlgM
MTDPISNNVARFAQPALAPKTGANSSQAQQAQTNSASAQAVATDKSALMTNTVSLSNVTQKVMQAPSFDRAKVDSIKKAIKEGNYPINAKNIAANFLSLEQMIHG